MLKIEKEYLEEFEDIPKEDFGRIKYLFDNFNIDKAMPFINSEINRIKNISYNTLNYVIYLIPKGTPRPRSGKHGVFYVKGAKDNKTFFKEFSKNFDITLITTPCKFKCKCYMPIPNSMKPYEKVLSELGFIRPTSKPDWDNLAKTYCDMIQDIILYDDSLIVEGSLSKFYSIKPRIEVEISYMTDYDSQYNKKKITKKGI